MNTELSTFKYLDNKNEDNAPPQQEKKRGGWNRYLTIICILFVISSFVGAISSARGIYGLTKPVEELKIARTAADREIQKIEIVQRDSVQKYFPLLMYSEIVKLFMAGALMVAAVYLFSQSPKARNFAIGVCFLALFFHVTNLVITILMISETGGAVNSMIADAFQSASFASEQERESAQNYVQNTMLSWITVIIAIVFLIKLVYYGVILAYLWSDDVKRVFGEDPLEYMAKEAAEDAARTGVPQTA